MTLAVGLRMHFWPTFDPSPQPTNMSCDMIHHDSFLDAQHRTDLKSHQMISEPTSDSSVLQWLRQHYDNSEVLHSSLKQFQWRNLIWDHRNLPSSASEPNKTIVLKSVHFSLWAGKGKRAQSETDISEPASLTYLMTDSSRVRKQRMERSRETWVPDKGPSIQLRLEKAHFLPVTMSSEHHRQSSIIL
jgi:hypothetical protein